MTEQTRTDLARGSSGSSQKLEPTGGEPQALEGWLDLAVGEDMSSL